MSTKIQEDMVGFAILVPLVNEDGTAFDFTLAESLTFIFFDSTTGVRLERTGGYLGALTDGIAGYVLNADLDDPGTWSMQIIITMQNGDRFPSPIVKIKVKANL